MWKNRSSYSKSEDRSEAKTWCFESGDLIVTVTKHIHFENDLIMTCGNVEIHQKRLGTTDMEKGKKKALAIVQNRLSKMTYAIEQELL